MTEGNPYSPAQGTEHGFRVQVAWQTCHMAETVTAFLIKVIRSRVNWAERRQGSRTYWRLGNEAAAVAGQR